MACLQHVVVVSALSTRISASLSPCCSSSDEIRSLNRHASNRTRQFPKSSITSFGGQHVSLIQSQKRWTGSVATSEEDLYLPDLQVPQEWVSPEAATREAEWLRGALHQWLDDEFCPEPANEEISRRCAKVYYYCLLENQLDVGDILMQMVRDLETFSFKDSFHGAFSSANAAIALITNKMRAREASTPAS